MTSSGGMGTVRGGTRRPTSPLLYDLVVSPNLTTGCPHVGPSLRTGGALRPLSGKDFGCLTRCLDKGLHQSKSEYIRFGGRCSTTTTFGVAVADIGRQENTRSPKTCVY